MFFAKCLSAMDAKIVPLENGFVCRIDRDDLPHSIGGDWQLPFGWYADDEVMLDELCYAATGKAQYGFMNYARDYNRMQLVVFLNNKYPGLFQQYKSSGGNSVVLTNYWHKYWGVE